MRRRRILSLAVVCGLLAGCGHQPRSVAPPEQAAVLQVVERFRKAILSKDKPGFIALFFSEDPERITWQSVLDERSLAWLRKTRPQSLKARYRPDNNFVAFIDSIVASKTVEEETFSDIEVGTDGDVAAVSFNYVYLSDGRPTNSGREKWLLVRTEQGWKIISVIYSVRLPEAGGG